MATTERIDYAAMHETMLAASPTYRRHHERLGHQWMFPAQAIEIIRVETGTEFPVSILDDLINEGEVRVSGDYRKINLADLLQALGY